MHHTTYDGWRVGTDLLWLAQVAQTSWGNITNGKDFKIFCNALCLQVFQYYSPCHFRRRWSCQEIRQVVRVCREAVESPCILLRAERQSQWRGEDRTNGGDVEEIRGQSSRGPGGTCTENGVCNFTCEKNINSSSTTITSWEISLVVTEVTADDVWG